MARQRKEKEKPIKLSQPDRSAPSEATLLDLAQERNLFEQAAEREQEKKRGTAGSGGNAAEAVDEAVLNPGAERFLEAMLWTATLGMLHFTLDVLVQNQYGVEIQWDMITFRTAVAWLVFFILFYPLHPHDSKPLLFSRLSAKRDRQLRQVIFFAMSTACGCALIHVTNSKGYLAVMKRAPPLACLWVWAVVELELPWAALSLAVAGGFLWQGGYSIK